MNNLRTLGLAAIAAMALMAFVSVASASASVGVYVGGSEASPKFEAKEYKAHLAATPLGATAAKFNFFRAEQNHEGGPDRCTTIDSTFGQKGFGVLAGPQDFLLSVLHYTGCTSYLGSAVKMSDDCFPTFYVTKTYPFGVHGGRMSVVCAEGHELEFTRSIAGAAVCTATIAGGVQFGGEEVYFVNSAEQIEVIVAAKEIEYTLAGPYCLEPGTHKDGTWNTSFKIQGDYTFS